VLQTVDVLNLNIFKLKTNQEVFRQMGLTIYSLKEIRYQDQRIILGVVGESHFLWIQGVFMELLACTKLTQQLPRGVELSEVFHGPKLNGLNFALTESNITYSVSVRFENYEAKVPEMLMGSGQQLAFVEEKFPFFVQDIELPCWTKIQLSQINQQLLLNTSHSYPPDYIVNTCSTIVLP